jgi:Na+/H+ antiporter NhaA
MFVADLALADSQYVESATLRIIVGSIIVGSVLGYLALRITLSGESRPSG